MNALAQLYGLGADAAVTPMQWSQQTIGSDVTFSPGQRYAVLASVATGTSTATIQSYVQKKGFQVTYLCEPPGGCTRDTYNIDTWLAGITAKPRSGERWVYAEGNFTGSSAWSVAASSSFPVTIVVTYSIADVFLAVAAPPSAAPAPIVAPVSTPAAQSGSPGLVVAGIATLAVAGGAAAWWYLRHARR